MDSAQVTINTMTINTFDACVYLVLFITGIISFYRGFIKEFVSLITWVGGALITFSLAPTSTAFMSQYIQSATGAAIIGTLGTYFLVIVTLGIVGKVVLRYIKKGADVGWFDNVAGLALGLFKGGILVVLAFVLITIVYKDEETYPEWLKQASTLPYIQSAALQMVRVLPDSVNITTPLEAPTAEEMAIQNGVGQNGMGQNGDDEFAPNTPQAIEGGLKQEYVPIQNELMQNGYIAPNAAQQPNPQQVSPLEQLILDATKE